MPPRNRRYLVAVLIFVTISLALFPKKVLNCII